MGQVQIKKLSQYLRETTLQQNEGALFDFDENIFHRDGPKYACAYGVLAWELLGAKALGMDYNTIASEIAALGYPEIQEMREDPNSRYSYPVYELLTYLNDRGWSFQKIADWLEEKGEK